MCTVLYYKNCIVNCIIVYCTVSCCKLYCITSYKLTQKKKKNETKIDQQLQIPWLLLTEMNYCPVRKNRVELTNWRVGSRSTSHDRSAITRIIPWLLRERSGLTCAADRAWRSRARRGLNRDSCRGHDLSPVVRVKAIAFVRPTGSERTVAGKRELNVASYLSSIIYRECTPSWFPLGFLHSATETSAPWLIFSRW